jgi:CubicO group peptidase (beta-lactamase class C family)
MNTLADCSRVVLLRLGALASLALLPLPALGQVSDGEVLRLMDEHAVPGLAIAIVTPDSTMLSGYGSADAAGSLAVTPETPFRLASSAKVLTAATVLAHARATGVDLRADIASTVDMSFEGTYTGPISLHDLLTHTAGFDERLVGYGARSAAEMRPLGEYLAERMPARGWPVGSIVSYSNHGMALAAYVVERRAGRSFADVAAAELFEPLGMKSTWFLTGGQPLPDGSAQPLSCADGACADVPHVFSHAYPAGLAFSTATDMSRFIAAMLSDESIVPGLEDLVPPRFAHDPRIPGMSYGFFNQVHMGRRALAHSGTVPGFWSLIMVLPDDGVGFVVMANGGDDTRGRAGRRSHPGTGPSPDGRPRVACRHVRAHPILARDHRALSAGVSQLHLGGSGGG